MDKSLIDGDLTLSLARWKVGAIPSEDLPIVAEQAVLAGIEASPSLRLLADNYTSDPREMQDLLTESARELGLQVPDEKTAALKIARVFGERYLAGAIDAESAAKEISREVGALAYELPELRSLAFSLLNLEEHRELAIAGHLSPEAGPESDIVSDLSQDLRKLAS